jgi:hypothetical protein
MDVRRHSCAGRGQAVREIAEVRKYEPSAWAAVTDPVAD